MSTRQRRGRNPVERWFFKPLPLARARLVPRLRLRVHPDRRAASAHVGDLPRDADSELYRKLLAARVLPYPTPTWAVVYGALWVTVAISRRAAVLAIRGRTSRVLGYVIAVIYLCRPGHRLLLRQGRPRPDRLHRRAGRHPDGRPGGAARPAIQRAGRLGSADGLDRCRGDVLPRFGRQAALRRPGLGELRDDRARGDPPRHLAVAPAARASVDPAGDAVVHPDLRAAPARSCSSSSSAGAPISCSSCSASTR